MKQDFTERLRNAQAKARDNKQVRESEPPQKKREMTKLGVVVTGLLFIGVSFGFVGLGLMIADIAFGKIIALLGLVIFGVAVYPFQAGSGSFSEKVFGRRAELPSKNENE